MSLNVGGGVRLIKPAKLYMCTQNNTNTTKTVTRSQVCAARVHTAELLGGECPYENWVTHITQTFLACQYKSTGRAIVVNQLLMSVTVSGSAPTLETLVNFIM